MSLYFFVFVFVFVFVLVFDDEKSMARQSAQTCILSHHGDDNCDKIGMIRMIMTMIKMRILEPDYGLNLAPRVMRAPLFLTRSVFRSRSNNFEP